MTDYEWVDTDDALAEVVADCATADRYAIDTEFHRERTYYPQVALVQLAWHDRIALIDPLAVSLAPFAKVLDGPGLAVMHAAGQDLEVLELACGTIPTRMVDTQVAAGFTGQATPSLADNVIFVSELSVIRSRSASPRWTRPVPATSSASSEFALTRTSRVWTPPDPVKTMPTSSVDVYSPS